MTAAAAAAAAALDGARSVAVPALTAWALAAGGTWRRLVTDPASGTVLDVDEHGRLMLDRADGEGRIAVDVGDVRHLRPAAP